MATERRPVDRGRVDRHRRRPGRWRCRHLLFLLQAVAYAPILWDSLGQRFARPPGRHDRDQDGQGMVTPNCVCHAGTVTIDRALAVPVIDLHDPQAVNADRAGLRAHRLPGGHQPRRRPVGDRHGLGCSDEVLRSHRGRQDDGGHGLSRLPLRLRARCRVNGWRHRWATTRLPTSKRRSRWGPIDVPAHVAAGRTADPAEAFVYEPTPWPPCTPRVPAGDAGVLHDDGRFRRPCHDPVRRGAATAQQLLRVADRSPHQCTAGAQLPRPHRSPAARSAARRRPHRLRHGDRAVRRRLTRGFGGAGRASSGLRSHWWPIR